MLSPNRRVVVTGMGVISPAGVGIDAFWHALIQEESLVKRIQLFDPQDLPSQIAGQVADFNATDFVSEKYTRTVFRYIPMAIAATREALNNAKLNDMSESNKSEMTVIVGTGGGGIGYCEKELEIFYKVSPRKISAHTTTGTFVGMFSSDISLHFGFKGQSHVISNGCTSATDAMGYAFNQIRFGQSTIAITGGADSCVTPAIITAFSKMGVLSTAFNSTPNKASRPFNIDRDGFVMGEGAWILVIEDLANATKRGAEPLAEIIGYGSTCDAYHKVAPHPSGEENARAMQRALADARLTPNEIEYINLHGTSTKLNDVTETKAIKLCFGDYAMKIPASSNKSHMGHPQGASGAMGIVATILGMKNGLIAPTVNYENPDPECDLDYIPNVPRKTKIRTALCNSIAFGAKNSTLVIKDIA